MTTTTTTQLNFPTTGSVDKELRAWLAQAKAGDTLLVDALCGLAGGLFNIPAGVKIDSKSRETCGFQFLDGYPAEAARNGRAVFQQDRFRAAGPGVELRNLRFTQTALEPADIESLGASGWGVILNDNTHPRCKVVDCHADNMQGWSFVSFKGADSEFSGNIAKSFKVAVGVTSGCDDLLVTRNHFSGGYRNKSNIFGDAIKTLASSFGYGPLRMKVVHNTFDRLTRDGVDNTGGWYEGICTDNNFISCGLDLKNHHEKAINIGSGKNITGVELTNPCVVRAPLHGYSNGRKVNLLNIGGTVELNQTCATITVIDADTFSLNGVDATAFSPYTSGGTAIQIDLEGTRTRRNEHLIVADNVFTGGAITYTFLWDVKNLGPIHDEFAPRLIEVNNNRFLGSRIFIKDGYDLSFHDNYMENARINLTRQVCTRPSRNITFEGTTYYFNSKTGGLASGFSNCTDIVLDFKLLKLDVIGTGVPFDMGKVGRMTISGKMEVLDPSNNLYSPFRCQTEVDHLVFNLDALCKSGASFRYFAPLGVSSAKVGTLVYSGRSEGFTHLARVVGSTIDNLIFRDFHCVDGGGFRFDTTNGVPGIATNRNAWNTIVGPNARLMANDVVPMENAWHRTW